MFRTAHAKPMFGLMVSTALTGALLAGCTTAAAPSANLSASRAQAALAAGKHDQAVRQAEAAVLAEPRNAAYRAMLGSAYLEAGRFASAATSFDDAMQLGDSSPRTALSLALAMTGEGKYAEASALLNEWEDQIATADLGLALALAGQPERGVALMSGAIRSGENTAKMRQNLAFAYALGGRWREARLMAEQDVPAGEVSARIEQWAALAQPQAWQQRVASLLSVPAGIADAGQPVQLALGNNPSLEQLAAEAAAPAPAAESAELPALAVAEVPAPVAAQPASVVSEAPYQAPTPALPSSFQVAFNDPAPAAQDGVEFVSSPVVQAAPARVAQAAPARTAAQPVSARVTQREDGTHLIQLGSFTSEAAARRAWSVYAGRYPELSGHRMVISQAVVQGKHYWRVAAAGFGRTSSAAACGRIKSAGQGCLAYAASRPLPGAVDTGTRLAQR